MRRVAVYCGASLGSSPKYAEAAWAFGGFLARRGLGVVYGGGGIGLMGAVADGALAAGGEVIGVIPDRLKALEVGHAGLTRLEVVPGMHERKLRMSALADGFVALPGGYGTLDEVFEAATWSQLEYHHKPVGLLDVLGYWQPLVAALDHMRTEGFVRAPHRAMIVCDPDPETLLAKMAEVVVPRVSSWLDAERGP